MLCRLEYAQVELPALIGGGDWSAGDRLAHIAFWEELALEAAVKWGSGQLPSIETVFREKTVDEVNADNQQRSRDLTLAAVRERAAAAHLALPEPGQRPVGVRVDGEGSLPDGKAPEPGRDLRDARAEN